MTDDEWMQEAQRTADAFRECGAQMIAACQRARAAMIAGFTLTPAQWQAIQQLTDDLNRLERR